MRCVSWAFALLLTLPQTTFADTPTKQRFALFDLLTQKAGPTLIAYTPSQLDPRQEANNQRLATSSIRADLKALRSTFDGLITYGYHEACTPRIVAIAKELKYRVVLLGIWNPKSTAEIDGVAALVRQYEKDFALGVLVGNEGITFKRYELDDLSIAANRLRFKLPKEVPLSTSEPLVGYKHEKVRSFGDFLAPNVHPVFDQPNLDPAESAKWARDQAARLAREIKKPVLLKETGFPHGGKDKFSPKAQADFWKAYVKPGLLAGSKENPTAWVYYGVAFEGFDLPWKAEASGLPIEKYWGLFSVERKPYPSAAVWESLLKKEK